MSQKPLLIFFYCAMTLFLTETAVDDLKKNFCETEFYSDLLKFNIHQLDT